MCPASDTEENKMRNFIIGTDWWSDCDDAVAMRLLIRAAKAKQINILGIGINACMEHSVTSLEGYLNIEKADETAIGIDLEAVDYGGITPYQERLSHFAKKYKSNSDAEDAMRLYRRLLAESEESVEIIEIGFQQVLANLLESPGDDISPESGLELVKRKVSKIWVMAGKWDMDGEKENNFCRTPRSRLAGEIFCRLCPVPVTFLGWEIGYEVLTGSKLAEDDILHKVLCDHGSAKGRHSWDPMLVLMAIEGDEEKAGYKAVTGTATVEADTGANHFEERADGLHKYVIKAKPDSYYADAIDELIG